MATGSSLYTPNTGLSTQRAFQNEIKPAVNDLMPQDPNDNALLQTSTNIFVYAQGAIVGMIQSFAISESRTINKLQAIGWEGVVQAVPSNTNGGQISVSRLALYESNIWSALGLTVSGNAYNPVGSKVARGGAADKDNWDKTTPENAIANAASTNVSSRLIFKTLKDQRTPLEIQVKTTKAGTGDSWYIERYIDCWLSSYSKSYSVGTITVAEQATIQYADVY
jgi:hypothetical protein